MVVGWRETSLVTALWVLSLIQPGLVAAQEEAAPAPAQARGPAQGARAASPTEPGQEPGPPASPTAGAEGVARHIQGLSSLDARVRVASVRQLGEAGDESAVAPLIRLVRHDPVPEVRGWALQALHDLGTAEAQRALAQAAQADPDERVRAMASRLTGVAVTEWPVSPTSQQAAHVPQAPEVLEQGNPSPPPRPPGRALRLTGWIMTGVSYGAALVAGLIFMADDPFLGGMFFVPVAGPVIAATYTGMGEEAIPFWVWSAHQLAGVVLLAVGYAKRARWLRQQRGTGRRGHIAWAPTGPRGTAGVTLLGVF